MHPRKDLNELPQADAESNISEWLEASAGSTTEGKSEWGQEDNELMVSTLVTGRNLLKK